MDLPPFDNPPESVRVRGLICSDEEGQVQVIAPETAIIDPTTINLAIARNLRGVPASEEQPVCAIPGYYGLPTVIHAGMKENNVLALATEAPGRYVKANGSTLDTLCAEQVSFEATFSEELQGTPLTTTDDEQSILSAVDEFTVRRIQARLDETLHIPPLPDAAMRILELQQDPTFDLMDLVRIVETDASLSARIIGWANSPLHASATPAKTLNDAIMRVLGFDAVFNMAVGLAIGSTLNLPASHVSGASPYWLSAVYTAAAMETLAHKVVDVERPNPGTAYLIGLLANFGTLVVGHVFPPQYELICRLQEANPQIHHTHIDQHVLRLNREVISATLLEQWNVPDEVTTALRFQYVPDYNGAHADFVHLLRLAESLVHDPLPDAHETMVLQPQWLEAAARANVSEDGLRLVAETLQESKQELGDLADMMMN